MLESNPPIKDRQLQIPETICDEVAIELGRASISMSSLVFKDALSDAALRELGMAFIRINNYKCQLEWSDTLLNEIMDKMELINLSEKEVADARIIIDDSVREERLAFDAIAEGKIRSSFVSGQEDYLNMVGNVKEKRTQRLEKKGVYSALHGSEGLKSLGEFLTKLLEYSKTEKITSELISPELFQSKMNVAKILLITIKALGLEKYTTRIDEPTRYFLTCNKEKLLDFFSKTTEKKMLLEQFIVEYFSGKGDRDTELSANITSLLEDVTEICTTELIMYDLSKEEFDLEYPFQDKKAGEVRSSSEQRTYNTTPPLGDIPIPLTTAADTSRFDNDNREKGIGFSDAKQPSFLLAKEDAKKQFGDAMAKFKSHSYEDSLVSFDCAVSKFKAVLKYPKLDKRDIRAMEAHLGSCYYQMGLSHNSLGNHQDAINHVEKALGQFTKTLGTNHGHTKRCTDKLKELRRKGEDSKPSCRRGVRP